MAGKRGVFGFEGGSLLIAEVAHEKGYQTFVRIACQSLPFVGWYSRSVSPFFHVPEILGSMFMLSSQFNICNSPRAQRVRYLCEWIRPWDDTD